MVVTYANKSCLQFENVKKQFKNQTESDKSTIMQPKHRKNNWQFNDLKINIQWNIK